MTPTEEAIEIINSKHWSTAKVWDYGVSHSILRIRMDESDEGLAFHDCNRIEFEIAWGVEKINIEQFKEGTNERYRVTDGNNLYVNCGQIYYLKKMDFGF